MAKSAGKRAKNSGGGEITSESLVITPFDEVFCQSLGVCTFFDAVVESTFEGDAQFDGGFWMHVLVQKRSETQVHLHVDVKRKFKKSRKPSSTFPTLIDHLQRFQGVAVKCWIRAEYLVPVSGLPSGGVISAFLGLATSAGGHDMTFRGATMKIDDPHLDELRWQLDDKGKSINIIIDGFISTFVGASYIEESTKILNTAFRKIVLQEEDQKQ